MLQIYKKVLIQNGKFVKKDKKGYKITIYTVLKGLFFYFSSFLPYKTQQNKKILHKKTSKGFFTVLEAGLEPAQPLLAKGF